jgi:VWA domain-containing protein
MSSRSRIRSDRRPLRAAVLLLALAAAQCFGPAPALAAIPLPVAAVLTAGPQTLLVVDLSASAGAGSRSVSVTRDGAAQPATLIPVVSADLAVTLVVDASRAGAATLPAWLSAGARFVLEAPGRSQSAVIVATSPAAVIAGPQRGATEIVRALSTVRARGDRDTAAALTLATRQFPATPPGRRVVVLYTTATDAGGEPATALGARFRSTGTILVVVGTADADPYWADAAAATGGFFSPAGSPVVVPALDQVQTTLRGRYLVQFPTPPSLPELVTARVKAGALTLTGDAVIPAPPAAPAPPARARPGWWRIAVPAALIAALAAIAMAAVIPLRRRSRQSQVTKSAQPPEPAPEPDPRPEPPVAAAVAVARGRASVPGTVARGRAAVPSSTPKQNIDPQAGNAE